MTSESGPNLPSEFLVALEKPSQSSLTLTFAPLCQVRYGLTEAPTVAQGSNGGYVSVGIQGDVVPIGYTGVPPIPASVIPPYDATTATYVRPCGQLRAQQAALAQSTRDTEIPLSLEAGVTDTEMRVCCRYYIQAQVSSYTIVSAMWTYWTAGGCGDPAAGLPFRTLPQDRIGQIQGQPAPGGHTARSVCVCGRVCMHTC